MPHRLDDRIALITGGSGHLGRAVVKRFLEAGATVHLPIFDEGELPALEGSLGDGFQALHLHRDIDLTDPAGVARLFAEVEEGAGQSPDILLNLAGGFAMAPVHETEPELWERMLALNAGTAFFASRAALPGMRERGWGRIVNVSALPALDRGTKGMAAYGASKAAVLNLTHTLAKEGVDRGVTANAVLPSIIDTPANREAMPDSDRSTWLPPWEIAGVLLFLASSEGRVVNGAAIPLTLG